uniref:Sodium/hydrogen exchanger n=1 Tax=Gasterosteus aculeatus aculeatus TaxID=481459 RepID=A0AAQ4Q6B6_GASAC
MQRCGRVPLWLLGSVLLIRFTSGISAVDRDVQQTRPDSRPEPPSESTPNQSHADHGHGSSAVGGIPVVTFKWHHVETPYQVALWILVAGLAKLVIEANHHVTNVIPESALLICFGFILGGIIWGADKVQTFKLNPTVFFFYLLPQIILDTGYSMPNKLFFGNMGAILVYAVIGTCWNAASLGLSLWGCHQGGAMGDLDIGLLQYLLFGSLIAAVDPVAVIAVFEQVHVNEVLFILVFGESLLNDGVTVVLFNVFDAFVSLGGARINAVEIIKGIISFFVVAFGGSLLGLVFGLLISLLTKVTQKVKIIEPAFVFVLGYLSYLTAEMLSLSSILSITFCGVSCQKYINANMAESSVSTVRYVMKVFANGSETIIFVFLGISAIDTEIWVWNTGFILLTLFFIFVYRIIGVFFLTWILNRYRLVPVEFIDQVIMSYGGLRGAVAYGLATLLNESKIKEKNLMICTTLLVVYFTVILQGITMKPLVNWLKVKKAAVSELTLIEKLQSKVFDHMLVAIEDISGQIGHNYMRDKYVETPQNYLTHTHPFLTKLQFSPLRKSRDCVFKVFHQLNLKDAMSYVAEVMSSIFNNTKACLVHVPSVSLEMHEQNMKGVRETEDINTHHLLQQHLYKGRKQHRHRYSRSHFNVNKDENEVQEIFQRTMRNRLESFKSAKMGVSPPKKIKGDASGFAASDGSHPFPMTYRAGGKREPPSCVQCSTINLYAKVKILIKERIKSMIGNVCIPLTPFPLGPAGIENPAYIPDLDPMAAEIPPWLAEYDAGPVAPSQRAQLRLPWTPSDLGRLAPLRISTRSNDSFAQADAPAAQQKDDEPPTPSKRDGRNM